MPRLTKQIVDAAKSKERAYFIWCSDLRGFGARVHPTGGRVYYVDYRNRDGARKRMAIGAHGKITTEEARKLALQTLGDAVKGEDPASERATRRNALTVKQLCDDYMTAAGKGLIFGKRGQPKKPYTVSQDRARINRHIAPVLGRKLVRDLTRADVAKFIRDVTVGKTAVVERTKPRGKAVVTGGAGTAARAANFLGAILTFAVSEGIVEHNVAHGVKRKADEKRTRRLTTDEYCDLGRALSEAEQDGETWQAVAGARLIALSACRLGEIIKLKWLEVDEKGGCFRLEDTKEGASVRPIGRRTFELLATLPRVDGNPYVLPAVRGGGTFGGLPHAFKRMAKRAGLTDVTPHVLRHSFASTAGDLGYSEPTIAAMLGHASGTVTSRYIHHLDAVLIAAASRVAARIDAAMGGDAGEVVPFKKGAGP
jgi:site-specific recombinase XerD